MDQKKRYTIAELFGVEGLYLYGHPGKQELSSGLFCYDLKENRFKKEQVGKKVTEDYGGAILLPIPIPFGNREMLGVKEEFEISCKSCKYITLQEYMDKATRMSHEKIVQTMEGAFIMQMRNLYIWIHLINMKFFKYIIVMPQEMVIDIGSGI